MDHFAGLDVSVQDTSVCIVDSTGKIIREVKELDLYRRNRHLGRGYRFLNRRNGAFPLAFPMACAG